MNFNRILRLAALGIACMLWGASLTVVYYEVAVPDNIQQALDDIARAERLLDRCYSDVLHYTATLADIKGMINEGQTREMYLDLLVRTDD